MAFFTSFAAVFIMCSASSALETFRSLYHASARVLLMLRSMIMSLFHFQLAIFLVISFSSLMVNNRFLAALPSLPGIHLVQKVPFHFPGYCKQIQMQLFLLILDDTLMIFWEARFQNWIYKLNGTLLLCSNKITNSQQPSFNVFGIIVFSTTCKFLEYLGKFLYLLY